MKRKIFPKYIQTISSKIKVQYKSLSYKSQIRILVPRGHSALYKKIWATIAPLVDAGNTDTSIHVITTYLSQTFARAEIFK